MIAFVSIVPYSRTCIESQFQCVNINPGFKYFFPPYLIDVISSGQDIESLPNLLAMSTVENSMDNVFSIL